MIVDCNAYVGQWPHWFNTYMSVEGLLHLMDSHGVDRAIVTSLQCVETNPAAGNDEAAAAVARHPGRLSWFCSVCPSEDEQALTELERAAAHGAKGLRLFPQHQAWGLNTDPNVGAVVALAQHLGLPVHLPLRLIMDWSLPVLPLHEVRSFVGRYPECTFILSGVNYPEHRLAVDILQKHPNTLLETSCLMGRDEVKDLVKRVGAERLLLGLGLPLQSAQAGLVKVEKARIETAAKELILGANAARLLDLRP